MNFKLKLKKVAQVTGTTTVQSLIVCLPFWMMTMWKLSGEKNTPEHHGDQFKTYEELKKSS